MIRGDYFVALLVLLAVSVPALAAPEVPSTMEQARAELEPKGGDRTLHRDPMDWPEAVRAPMLAAQVRGLLLARRHTYADHAAALFPPVAGAAAPLPLGATLVELRGEAATVHRIGETVAGIVSSVRVDFDAAHPAGVLQPVEDVALDPAGALAQACRAMRLAAADPQFVSKWPTYGADVVPWSEVPGEGWAVYLLPTSTDLARVPIGGGYRVHVSQDATSVTELLPLSKTVMEVPVTSMQEGAGIFTSSVLTPIPDATYVAFSKFWGITVFIVTEDAAWGIYGDSLYRLALPR